MNTITRISTASLLLALLLSFAAILEASDNSTVNVGATSDITAHTVCKKVTNGSATGLSVYIPTQTSAEWSSFYTNPPAGVTAGACAAPCALPWGGTIAHGQSVTAYSVSQVNCSGPCPSETRTCNNGTLSGSYTYQSCSVRSCTWLRSTAHSGWNCPANACSPTDPSGHSCSSAGSSCRGASYRGGCAGFVCAAN